MNGSALATAKPISFIVTRDRTRAKAFYGDILGFRLTGEDDYAAVFDMHGIMLRISTLPDHVPAAHTVLGWEVSDIASTVTSLAAKGVKFNRYEGLEQDDLCIWQPPGSHARIAWFLDPDGNNLSLTAFHSQRP